MEISNRTTRNPLATALRRLDLCAYAVQEIHLEVDQPQDSEQKADLLIATERLVAEVIDLYQTVRVFAWGDEANKLQDEDED